MRVRRAEVGEFVLRLSAEIGAIDEEQHTTCAGVLDEPVDGGDRHDRLARAGGHLNEGTRMVGLERLFEVLYGADLVGVEEVPLDRRKGLKARAEGGRIGRIGGVRTLWRIPVVGPFWQLLGLDPLAKGLGSMELEDLTRAGMRIEVVPEDRLRAGADVAERERCDRRMEIVGEARGVLVGLNLDATDGIPFRFGFERANGHPVDEDHVVGVAFAADQRELADDHAGAG